ncbi:NADPH-dependent FMN reductase, partial [Acidiphilium iwatense]
MDDGEFPALHRDLLLLPDPARLEPVARATHKPRVLLLYGSLRERSYSRFATEEAARLLDLMGAETRIYDPRDLPVANSVP